MGRILKWLTGTFLIFFFLGTLFPGISYAKKNPLRIIATQTKEKPAIYIMLDRSGSLRFLPDRESTSWYIGVPYIYRGRCYHENYRLYERADFTESGWGAPRCGSGNGYWIRASVSGSYSWWYFMPPSRIAMVKNFFGDSMPIYDVADTLKNIPRCSGICSGTSAPCWGYDAHGEIFYRFPANGGPLNGAYYDLQRGRWVNYTCNNSTPPKGDPQYTKETPPFDFVAKNINVAFWGMGYYYSSRASQITPGLPTDTNGNVSSVTSIRNAMRPVRRGGLSPGGSTPTTRGLNFVKNKIYQWWRDPGNAKGRLCNRPFYTILITDGKSNRCNPNDRSWSNCPDDWVKYPAGRSDEAFLKLGLRYSACQANPQRTTPTNVQTFVVGISEAVGKCELNMIAYMGRTDKSSPAGDAGVDWASDPRLPQNLGGTTTLANFDPSSGDYAFFTKEPEEFQKAMETILSAILAGDYNTSTPSGTIAAGEGAAIEEYLLVPSTKMPGWKGSLRLYKSVPCGDTTSSHDYDITTLTFNELCSRLKEPGKVIYAGNPTCDATRTPHFHLIWDAACSLKDQIDTSQSDLKRNVFSVSPQCGTGSFTGLDPDCQSVIKIQKNAQTINWLRTNITTINWSAYDFDQDGIPANTDDDDVMMFIEFILGGDGRGNVREWIMADIIGNGSVIISTPVAYTLSFVPPKNYFDMVYRNRDPIVYATTNGGFLHAFRLRKHRLNDSSSLPIELWSFVPPQVFDQLLTMFENYLKDPAVPTGQAKQPNFTEHIWTMTSPLNFADIWDTITREWKTVLFVPLGPNDSGLFAFDVTDPKNNVPRPLWYWSKPGTPVDSVWAAGAIGPTPVDGKTLMSQFYEGWVVAINTVSPSDSDDTAYLAFLRADTGEELKVETITPEEVGQGLVPFHMYSNMALASMEVDLNKPDMLNTHAFFVDTKGHIHIYKINKENPTQWALNSNNPILDFTEYKPIYFVPSIAHGMGRESLVVAGVTGSVLDDDPDINDDKGSYCGSSSEFCTEFSLAVLNYDKNTGNFSFQNDANHFYKITIDGNFSFGVDYDGDGTADKTVTPSEYARATARPIIVMDSFKKTGGTKGTAYYPLFEPRVYNPVAEACTGESYLLPVTFDLQLDNGGSPEFASQPRLAEPVIGLGPGIVSGITVVSGRLVTLVSGYGQGLSYPSFTPFEGPPPPPPIPVLGGVQRIE